MASDVEWGVFVWTPTNRYPRDAALHVYRTESPADRRALVLNSQGKHDSNVVVRPVYPEPQRSA